MENKLNTDKRITAIKQMIMELNTKDRKEVSDQLLSFLLFDEKFRTSIAEKSQVQELKNSNLNSDEIAIIKELAKRTEDLKNLLGENPNLFM